MILRITRMTMLRMMRMRKMIRIRILRMMRMSMLRMLRMMRMRMLNSHTICWVATSLLFPLCDPFPPSCDPRNPFSLLSKCFPFHPISLLSDFPFLSLQLLSFVIMMVTMMTMRVMVSIVTLWSLPPFLWPLQSVFPFIQFPFFVITIIIILMVTMMTMIIDIYIIQWSSGNHRAGPSIHRHVLVCEPIIIINIIILWW